MSPDAEPFLPLFLAAQADLRAFIGATVQDRVLREDVFQEVAMALWRSFDRYDSSRSFGAWARGVAVRKIMENRRVRSRLPDYCTLDVLEALSDRFEAQEEQSAWAEREQALAFCLELLPEKSARVMSARYGKGELIEQIAADMGLKVEAVYQALCRVRKQLRECVQRRLGLPTNQS
jgi:RNA polymerase sigma-70 factor (ECF subfamily)